MTAHPPTDPSPKVQPDSFRTAANRRIFVFVTLFTLLLIGALALVLREEKRRGALLIQPEKLAPPEAVMPAPASAPVRQRRRCPRPLLGYRQGV